MDLDSTVCEVCGKAKHGAVRVRPHQAGVGLSPAGGGAIRHRGGAALADAVGIVSARQRALLRS